MRKGLLFSLLLVVTILLCTACQGDVTRALRHDGFNISGEFICDTFYGEDAVEKIRYLTSDKIITDAGRIYEISLGQKFSNGSNCKIADTALKVVAVFDNRIFKADDGKLYTLSAENNSSAYTEVSTSDNSYPLYHLLLSQDGVVKVMTADSNSGIYYTLKSDGNVYGVTVSKGDRDTQPSIVGSVVVYNSADYGGTITDFAYYGDNSSTFVRTDSKIFRMKPSNFDECSKYADVPCNYSMMEATALEENKDYILAYNGSTIITTYKKVFTVSG